jgi:hypothetical protein
MAFEALETARLATALAVGETLDTAALVALVGLAGAGDAVDVREDLLVGEGSNAGKSPRGCWRVETIVSSMVDCDRRDYLSSSQELRLSRKNAKAPVVMTRLQVSNVTGGESLGCSHPGCFMAEKGRRVLASV